MVAREGLARIDRIFELDASWSDKPPSETLRLRQAHLRPHMGAFFAWAEQQYGVVRNQRGLLRSALGYAVRQKEALMRVLEDGRLVLDNNRCERELRTSVALGRKAWMFVGSDDHGASAGNIFSLIASARLHGLDPEQYLRDLFRVLPHWPRDRHLELAPKYWAATRARLNPTELLREIGTLTIPHSTTQESPADCLGSGHTRILVARPSLGQRGFVHRIPFRDGVSWLTPFLGGPRGRRYLI